MKKYFLINYSITYIGKCIIIGQRTTTHKPFSDLLLINVLQNKGKWRKGDMINLGTAWKHVITFESDRLEEVTEQAMLEML